MPPLVRIWQVHYKFNKKIVFVRLNLKIIIGFYSEHKVTFLFPHTRYFRLYICVQLSSQAYRLLGVTMHWWIRHRISQTVINVALTRVVTFYSSWPLGPVRWENWSAHDFLHRIKLLLLRLFLEIWDLSKVGIIFTRSFADVIGCLLFDARSSSSVLK